MGNVARSRSSVFLQLTCALLGLSLVSPAVAQSPVGSIVGHIRIHGDAPPERILVSLELRGTNIESVYTDSQGAFGFHTLYANGYYVNINDEHYQPVRQEAIINGDMLSQTVYLEINLALRTAAKPETSVGGADPNLVDIREYSAHFPKSALKEFDKGSRADREGNKDDAIRHYQKALQIAPSYYPAHNNLGSDYLSKTDFVAARKEFEAAAQLNPSAAAAYFNLSNVCMLMNQLVDAQRFLGEGLRRQPDSALGQFLEGSLDLRLNKFSEAESALRRAVQLDPGLPQARLQLVNLLLKQGRKADAINQLQDFVKNFPDSPFNPQAKQILHRLDSADQATSVHN
jgi:tetratricopeptide (TPR) repeat protein